MFETPLNEHSANNRAMSLSHGRRDFAYRNQSLTHLGDLCLSMGKENMLRSRRKRGRDGGGTFAVIRRTINH